MTFQRRHYEEIAKIVRMIGGDIRGGCVVTPESLAKRVASELDATNPNFNRARFLKACGVEGEA